MKEVLSVIYLDLHPDKTSVYCLDDQSRKCSSLYNNLLELANQEKQKVRETGDNEARKTLYSAYGLRNLVPGMKEIHPYLKSVHSSPLKNTALRLTAAIHAYDDSCKGKRKGKRIRWPRFHAWKSKWFSLFYDEPGKGYKVIGNKLQLSLGMGLDRKQHSLQIPIADAHLLKDQDVRNLRIIKEHGIFRAAFTIARKVPDPKPITKIIAFDPNHKNLLYGVDNNGCALEIQAPYWLEAYDRRIDELRSALDQCKKKSKKIEVRVDTKTITYWEESRRYKKLREALNKALAKRREHIKLFCYRIANQICKHYDFIAVGDYAPQGQGITTSMRRAMNNRSVIGTCKTIIAWVALKSGKTFYEYDETGTTRTCHACGFIVQEGIHPSKREWLCQCCITIHIRDENAACNGLRKAYKKIEEISEEHSLLVPSSGRVPIKERWAWRVLSSGTILRRGGNTADYNPHLQEIKTDGVMPLDHDLYRFV